MSQILHCPKLTLNKLLTVIPDADVVDITQTGQLILNVVWREPEHIQGESDLYGVKVLFRSKGGYLSTKKFEEYIWAGTNIELDICEDDTHLNGQDLLNDKLKTMGLHCWIDNVE